MAVGGDLSWDRVAAAAGAAVASALITNPMDVVKTRVQTQAYARRLQESSAYCHQLSGFAGNNNKSGGAGGGGAGAQAGGQRVAAQLFGAVRPQHGGVAAAPGSGLAMSCSSCTHVGVDAAATARAPAQACQHLYRGTLDAARKIVRSEGLKVLWRGTPAALAMAVPQVGIYMPTYEALKSRLLGSELLGAPGSEGAQLQAAMLSGTISRTLAVVITSPLERWRTRAQAGIDLNWRSVTGCRNTFASLWRGTVATLARDVPFSGIYWLVTEKARKTLSRRSAAAANHGSGSRSANDNDNGSFKDVAYVNLLSGTIGGTVAATLTTPLDVVKTRIQVSGGGAPSSGGAMGAMAAEDVGVRRMLARIVAKEGVGRLFDGATARAARAAPSCAIVLTSYEVLKKILKT